MPLGFRAEDGLHPDFATRFNMKETIDYSYRARTLLNIENSDGTLIIARNLNSFGTKFTIRNCQRIQKPYIINPTKEDFLAWIWDLNMQILNVAGNRESRSIGTQEKTEDFLLGCLGDKIET